MTSGFHGGELAVQRRAGVGDEASRLAGMLDAHGTRLHVHAFPAEGIRCRGSRADSASACWRSSSRDAVASASTAR
jgi:hypothetical protein